MTHNDLRSVETEQAAFIREILTAAPEFRAFAVFDEPRDCIRVVLKDCSTTEIRVNDLLTVLEANYPTVEGASDIVGFTIKGVAHICETHHISADATWKLAAFLDAVLQESAPRERVLVKKVVKPMAAFVEDVERMAA